MKSKDSNSKKSVPCQKKDGRGWPRPSFFWYDNDKDLKLYFLMTGVKSVRNFKPFIRIMKPQNCTTQWHIRFRVVLQLHSKK